MKYFWALLLSICCSNEGFAQVVADAPGDEFRITLTHSSESKGDNGSSSSSRGGHEYVERVDAAGPEGTERTFDITLEPDDERRLIEWQFPARVLVAPDGTLELLNRDDLERRRDAWLEAAEIPAEACGSWYFTWNAFQVECDPDAILETIRSITIQPPALSEGELYEHPMALSPGRLAAENSSSQGSNYSVVLEVDPDAVRRAEARSDVVVGELMREPVSFESAYAERAKEQISGTIEVTLEARGDGTVWKRSTSTEIEKQLPDGTSEHETSLEVIERVPLES